MTHHLEKFPSGYIEAHLSSQLQCVRNIELQLIAGEELAMNYEILQFAVSRSFVVFPFGGNACSDPHPQQILPTSVNACFLLCKISNTPSSSTMLHKDPSRFCFGLAALELIVYKKLLPPHTAYRVSCPSKSTASSCGIIS